MLEAQRTKAIVGLRPPKRPDGKLETERQAVEIGYDEIKWANKKPSRTPGVGDVLQVGDAVWVAPKNPDQPTGVWSLMQIPEVGGGIVAMDPHTGRVLAIVGVFSFSMSQFDRAAQKGCLGVITHCCLVSGDPIRINGYIVICPENVVTDSRSQVDGSR